MVWKIELEPPAQTNLAKLDNSVRARIIDFLRIKLPAHPNPTTISEPMKGNFHGLRLFVVGDYRLIFEITEEESTIIIHRIGHRKDVYD